MLCAHDLHVPRLEATGSDGLLRVAPRLDQSLGLGHRPRAVLPSVRTLLFVGTCARTNSDQLVATRWAQGSPAGTHGVGAIEPAFGKPLSGSETVSAAAPAL